MCVNMSNLILGNFVLASLTDLNRNLRQTGVQKTMGICTVTDYINFAPVCVSDHIILYRV